MLSAISTTLSTLEISDAKHFEDVDGLLSIQVLLEELVTGDIKMYFQRNGISKII